MLLSFVHLEFINNRVVIILYSFLRRSIMFLIMAKVITIFNKQLAMKDQVFISLVRERVFSFKCSLYFIENCLLVLIVVLIRTRFCK